MSILFKIAVHARKAAEHMERCDAALCSGAANNEVLARRIVASARLVEASGADLKARRQHLRTLAAEVLYALACVVWDINEARGPTTLQSGVPCWCIGLNSEGGFDPPHMRGEYGCNHEDR